MFNLRIGRKNQAGEKRSLHFLTSLLLLLMATVLFFGCQKSESPTAANAPQKAASATAPKDASTPEANELNYDKAMAKQYPEGAPVTVTGKVTQTLDEKSILMATRKDDVFGYLDNIVTVTFAEKQAAAAGDIIRVKTKSAGIKKYKTEGKGEYDAPFLKGETMEILEKGKPAK